MIDLWLIIVLGILLLVTTSRITTGGFSCGKITSINNSKTVEGYADYYIPWWKRIINIPPYYSGNSLPYTDNAWYWWPYYGPQRFWSEKGEPFLMSNQE